MPHKKNNLYSIGELSKLSGISIVTIRHYDDIGLVKPAYIDPESGYRYYSDNELFWYMAAHSFKNNNFSLAQIKSLLNTDKIDKLKTIYQDGINETEKEIQKLITAKQRLKARIEIFDQVQNINQRGYWINPQIEIKELNERKTISIRNKDPYSLKVTIARTKQLYELAKQNDLYIIDPTVIVFYNHYTSLTKENLDFETCFTYHGELDIQKPFHKIIPGGLYATMLYKGDMEETILKYYPLFLDLIQKYNYTMIGPVMKELKIYYQHVKSLKETVSELQVQIKK